jgi:hypothetical protein
MFHGSLTMTACALFYEFFALVRLLVDFLACAL